MFRLFLDQSQTLCITSTFAVILACPQMSIYKDTLDCSTPQSPSLYQSTSAMCTYGLLQYTARPCYGTVSCACYNLQASATELCQVVHE